MTDGRYPRRLNLSACGCAKRIRIVFAAIGSAEFGLALGLEEDLKVQAHSCATDSGGIQRKTMFAAELFQTV
jgi:hypothetical protein